MASHNLNDMSSRSHAMLSIQIEHDLQGYDDPKEQMTRQGKLVFVDLAGKNIPFSFSFRFFFVFLGSEKVKISHSKGKQLVETNNINKSLLTLGN
jgi:kinesin family protein 12